VEQRRIESVLTFNSHAEQCRWIFAYGSLMWRPGFEYVSVAPARLSGFHRRLSVYSYHYRGTPENPGLVLGLDRGGSCAGLAYEISDEKWHDTLAYVREREMITGVYREIIKQVYGREMETPVQAVTYAVNRSHAQCAPPMSVAKTMIYIERGHGLSGSCADYVANTINHLRSMGIHDAGLEKLAPHLNISSGVDP
jgi:glutathione-specific gamma-glutamylcyclotransferase